MLLAPTPANEQSRLAELAQLDLLYVPPEKAFDRITSELARIFDAPMAAISLMDESAQFFLSHVGLPGDLAVRRIVPRNISLCGHVVAENAAMVISDLSSDSRFVDNPMVTGTGARFYAGVPLQSDSGAALGTVCIMDSKPRELPPREAELLQLLASEVMTAIKLRRVTLELHGISQRLSRRNAAVERELSEARIVQQFLLPPTPQMGPGFHICHTYHPYDHIGGDFVDVHVRGDGTVVLFLADVSGHGASAALTSAMTKTCFHRFAATANEPGEVLTAINAELAGIAPHGRFMTAVAAIYRPLDHTVTLASAGHPYPFILRADGSDPVLIETSNEPPLLIDSDRHYKESMAIALEVGDRLVLYTDGAIEATSPTGEFLTFTGLSRLLAEHTPLRGAEFLAALFEGISHFANNSLGDDVAIVSLECAYQELS